MQHTRAFALLLGAAVTLTSAWGCELITSVDRSKIPGAGGGGGIGTGGTGGSTSSSGGGGGGGAAPCTAATECPGADDDCQARTCDNGVCGVSFTADGTATTTQADGDCKQVVCDGAGSTKSINDDNDLPDDGDPCTDDVCDMGAASNPPSASGTVCGTDLICDGNGACVGCVDATDCPGVDDECETRTCAGGVCGFDFTAAGTPVTAQMPGDCKKDQCDGAGKVESVNDNTDKPEDNKQCTQNVCNAGVPSNPSESAGLACTEGGGKVCDGNGACVGCVNASSCPGVDDECQMRTCAAGVCGMSFMASGTALTTQTPHDCLKSVCDGAGAITDENDDTDLPDDGNDCTTDACNLGVPSNTNVASGTSCGAGLALLCDAKGQCLGCLTGADCPGVDDDCQTRNCTAGVCGFDFQPNNTPVTAQTANDCKKNVCDGAGNTVSVDDDTDAPVDDGNACTDDICVAGVANHPAKADTTPCDDGDACTQTDTCLSGVCNGANPKTCTAMDQCHDAGTCDPADGTCSNPSKADNTTCDDSNLCTQTDTCQAGICTGANAKICTAMDQCHVAGVCNPGSGTCSDPPATDGAGCNDGDACTQTDTCLAGVCTGGSPKVCTASDECHVAGTCSAGVCSNPNAMDGTPCSTGVCSTGTCVSASCTDNTQNGAETDVDCGGGTCPACALTKVCGGDTDCLSGHCVGSVCVQCVAPSECPGTDDECQTRTCNANTCGVSFTAAGFVTASQLAGDCQQNRCDGAGLIVSVNFDSDKPVDGIECTDDVCTAGAPSNPNLSAGTGCGGTNVCDGSGACVQCNVASDCGADTLCKTFACNSGTCSQNNVAAGAVVTNTTAGDCHSDQCDGSGGITANAIDDTDLPVDGIECTDDVCNAGAPSNPALGLGTTCTIGGTVCDGAGACVTPPEVASTTPGDGASALANTTIAVTFTTAMNTATLTGQATAGACSGSIQVSLDDFASCIAFSAAAPTMSGGGTIATFAARPGLLINRTYKIRVTTAATSTSSLPLPAQYTAATGFGTTNPLPSGSGVVISQVYGGGGNASAAYQNDFVELHNNGTTTADVGGWSVQYQTQGQTSWAVTAIPAGATIPPGGYFLIQEFAPASPVGAPLPTPNVTGGTINLNASQGKVALVSNSTTLAAGCPSGSMVDLVQWGTASQPCFEGTTFATAPSGNTNALIRQTAGCTDANQNSTDFTTGPVNPRNSASAAFWCSPAQNESGSALEANFCDTQWPLSITAAAGTTDTVYGRIREAGVTDLGMGAPAGVLAQLGYGPATANPEYEAGWSWAGATYNMNYGSDAEYQATLTLPAAGTYRYAYRFSLDNGASWTYCDNNQSDGGAGSEANLAFSFEDEAVLVSQ